MDKIVVTKPQKYTEKHNIEVKLIKTKEHVNMKYLNLLNYFIVKLSIFKMLE